MSPWIGLLAITLPMQLAADPVPPATLPASMIGVWGWNDASCANPNDDGRVNVEPAAVTFHVAAYRLKSILVEPDKAIQATALVQEEGLEDREQDKSEHTIRLSLVTPYQLRISTEGSDKLYLRCKSGESQ